MKGIDLMGLYAVDAKWAIGFDNLYAKYYVFTEIGFVFINFVILD